MNDDTKFRTCVVLSIVLVISIITYNSLQEHFSTEIGSYIKRRIYYERVISPKGLPLHNARHWKKVDE